jgi:AraC-like DNA-binding protein
MNLRTPARTSTVVRRVDTQLAAVVRPRFLSANRMQVNRHDICRLHRHMQYEMVYVERGLYRTRLNHVPLVIGPGQLLAVAPGDWHEDDFVPPLVIHGLHFDLEVPALHAPAALFRPGTRAQDRVVSCRGTELPAIMQELQRAPAMGDAIARCLQDAHAATFFWLLARRLPPDALAPALVERDPDEAFVMGFRRLLERFLDRDLPVARMAAELGMSASALTGRCRRCLGASPAQAFARARIERAEALLARTAMSVAEVASYLGYADQFHFSKVFKRLCGRPPSRVRRQPL